MLWETDEVENTWTYFPEKETIFHRHIHIGNFFRPKKNFTITEVIGERSYAELESAGRKIEYLKRPIDFNQSDYAYVVYDKNYSENKKSILNYLEDIGFYTLGRFGEWEYYNMDICIKKSIDLAKKIVKY